MGSKPHRPLIPPRHGRVRIVGIDPHSDGHTRISEGPGYRAEGGSVDSHEQLQAVSERMVAELRARGYKLDDLTWEQYEEVAALIAEWTSPSGPQPS